MWPNGTLTPESAKPHGPSCASKGGPHWEQGPGGIT